MNYLLIGFTFIIIAVVFIGISLLATDRLFPARQPILFIARDGIDIAEDRETPILLPDGANPEDYRAVKLATSFMGYHRGETDELLARLVAENERLRAQVQKLGDQG